MKRLWIHIAPRRRKQMWALLMLMVITSMGEVVSIGALLPFLGVLTAPEKVFDNEYAQPFIEWLGIVDPSQLLLPLMIMFTSAALLSGGLRMLLLWVQTHLSQAVGVDLSYEIYRRTLYQSYAKHVTKNSSEIIAGIVQKSDMVVGYIIYPTLVLVSSALILISILVVLLSIDPVVASTVLVAFGVIYGMILFITKPQLLRNSRCIDQMTNDRVKALQEGLGGIRDVLLDGVQETYCQIYREADIPLRRALANNQFIGGFPRFGIEALGMALIALLAYSLSTTSDGVADAIPILGVLVLGAQRMLPVLQQGYSSWSYIRGGQESLYKMLDFLEQPLPAYASAPIPAPIQFDRSIGVKQLGFRYGPKAPWVLRGLELNIPKGSRVGFIGATGSGKSTLLDILMGLLEPTEGQLCIDDTPIDVRNERSWQAHIAHVPQSIFLADTSIAENIAIGVSPDQIDNERVRWAAQQAQIADTIGDWAKQYETPVGERGVRLSGGQRQRIGIARALYKQANVIVFDEATSALDNDTERAVMEAIENIGREITILIVAHRLTTLKGCDLVVELEQGKLKRQGNYLEMVID